MPASNCPLLIRCAPSNSIAKLLLSCRSYDSSQLILWQQRLLDLITQCFIVWLMKQLLSGLVQCFGMGLKVLFHLVSFVTGNGAKKFYLLEQRPGKVLLCHGFPEG